MQANELPDLFNHTPARKDCRAAIYFANPAFPPITYLYGSGSCHFGSENASFQVPVGVPNGDAYDVRGGGTYLCARHCFGGTWYPPSFPVTRRDYFLSNVVPEWQHDIVGLFSLCGRWFDHKYRQKHNFEYKHNVKHNAKYKHNRNHSRKHHEYVRRWHTAVLCGYQRGSIHSTLQSVQ
ncbi:hypothetical protein PspLS_10914 [Pyricularia sp. CBS 133598]|nr:hypothetical protein PspLS_10914 [Pyricularia sp. CBS 133598]